MDITVRPPTIARALIVNNDSVAVFERNRAGRAFAAFPGGHIEQGESPEQAVAREVREELSLDIPIQNKLVYIYASHEWGIQYYFYVPIAAQSRLILGEGSEEFADNQLGQNTYKPVWVPVDSLKDRNVLPIAVARQFAIDYASGKIQSNDPVLIQEEGES